jgi:putative Mg2+ transporter-C (MgtC) family protein
VTITGFETDVAVLLRILLATVLGGAIGWERETTGKAAGLRTHMLVCAGATLFIALGNLLAATFEVDEFIRADPLRIIEAIVAGVSFLGAGTIFVSRGERQVVGLTTAASI